MALVETMLIQSEAAENITRDTFIGMKAGDHRTPVIFIFSVCYRRTEITVESLMSEEELPIITFT